ncbi:CBR1 reductase, partial [Calcarius ornatus]|nr:CBR1 reductase [Calcarius ornatus]
VHDTTPFAVQAEVTLKTNFFGTRNVCTELLPLMKPYGKDENPDSMFQKADLLVYYIYSIKRKLYTKTILKERKKGFHQKAGKEWSDKKILGAHEKEGWPNTAYGVSKIGVTVLSRIQARLLNEQRKGDHILLNACCPGWVRTDMAGPKATKSPEEGAETPVYLALLPSSADAPHGQFVSEKTVRPW